MHMRPVCGQLSENIFIPGQSMGRKQAVLALVDASRRTRVLLADPYPVIVHGLRKMLEDDLRFEVVAEALTLASCHKKILAQRPQVALLDWSMAAKNLEFTTALLQSARATTGIIFLTVSESSPQKREMLRLGARVFLSKWCSAAKLRTAASRACKGLPASGVETFASDNRSVLPAADAEQRVKQLTERERQLIPLVCSGLKNKEIAKRLGIAESTVWHHLTAVFTKLKVEDRLGLAAFAFSHRPALTAAQSHPALGSAPGPRVVKPFPPGLQYSHAAND
jgi:two-component system, NarL family, nitrate/nitrite response regulator NarL